jgi:hypothetical protein
LKEIKVFKEKADRVHRLLCDFGIDDPEAVKLPLNAVNLKLKEILPGSNGFEVDPEKAADLIGKAAIYDELKGLHKSIVKSPFMEKIRWNKKQFSIKPGYEKELREDASVTLTSKAQIDLYESIEAFIKESKRITDALGEKFHISAFNSFLNVFKISRGDIVINHHIFLRETKHLEGQTEIIIPKRDPRPERINPFAKHFNEIEAEAKARLVELERSLQEKADNGILSGKKEIQQEIVQQNGILSRVEAERRFYKIKGVGVINNNRG